jgi:hypothetical protein
VKLSGLSKKLQLEAKIRDAALSLAKANASYKQMSKQTSEQLETAERKVDLAQKEYWRVSERANEIDSQLVRHRAAVLALSVRSMEEKMNPLQLPNSIDPTASRNRTLSPASPILPVSPATARFDGAHLFAGHAAAVSPLSTRPPSQLDITVLEAKLKAATDALSTASKKQAEMTRELSMLRLEKEETQTTMDIELQSAQDTIASLEAQLVELKAGPSKDSLDQEEARSKEMESVLSAKDDVIRSLQKRVGDAVVAGASHGEASARLVQVQEDHAKELMVRDAEKRDLMSALEMEKLSWSRLQSNMETEHASRTEALSLEIQELRSHQEDAINETNAQVDEASSALRQLLQTHNIVVTSLTPTLLSLVAATETHLAALASKVESHAQETESWEIMRRKLQDDIQAGLDKRQDLAREVEEARHEREEARRELRLLEQRNKAC